MPLVGTSAHQMAAARMRSEREVYAVDRMIAERKLTWSERDARMYAFRGPAVQPMVALVTGAVLDALGVVGLEMRFSSPVIVTAMLEGRMQGPYSLARQMALHAIREIGGGSDGCEGSERFGICELARAVRLLSHSTVVVCLRRSRSAAASDPVYAERLRRVIDAARDRLCMGAASHAAKPTHDRRAG